MPKFKNLTGERFGRITVLEFSFRNENLKAIWLCKCDCGSILEIIGGSLVSKRQVSCGCFKNERVSRMGKLSLKHGLSHTPEMAVWKGINQRCFNKRCKNFNRYGGIGIFPCKFIKESPANIVSLIGLKPAGTSIDRINNKLGYSCGSCSECASKNLSLNIRWATPKTQTRNRNKSWRTTLNGKTKHILDFAEELGIKNTTVVERFRHGKRGAELFKK
jgi:hypothetical protein